MSAPANSSCLVLNRKRKWGSGIVEIKVAALPRPSWPSGGMFGWGSSSSTSALSNASTSSLGGFPTGNFAPTTPQLAKKAKQSQPDQKSTVDKRALIPCRHHAKGKCKRDSCPFLHD
ncbi:hypothetical protein EG328_003493 [Venturia inaequalis]|uniref:C3H1-type domain-containing protein n=1 Tax=Venturia inaequalis TaxID=5025 RepID=A0A8H3UQ47_VENIN|nr:hypothetical protein EG328_003493 [Venturia inaequalis]